MQPTVPGNRPRRKAKGNKENDADPFETVNRFDLSPEEDCLICSIECDEYKG
jgi:hypothetical protein